MRRNLSRDSRGPHLVCLLARSVSQPSAQYVAELPQSALLWDVFAVSTYATVSLLFWYMGMIPDLATLRDRATSKIKQFAYGLFALGWTGSARQWSRYEKAYMLLAALATPLVLSVHTIVSFRLCCFAASRLAYNDLSALLSSRVPCLVASRWWSR